MKKMFKVILSITILTSSIISQGLYVDDLSQGAFIDNKNSYGLSIFYGLQDQCGFQKEDGTYEGDLKSMVGEFSYLKNGNFEFSIKYSKELFEPNNLLHLKFQRNGIGIGGTYYIKNTSLPVYFSFGGHYIQSKYDSDYMSITEIDNYKGTKWSFNIYKNIFNKDNYLIIPFINLGIIHYGIEKGDTIPFGDELHFVLFGVINKINDNIWITSKVGQIYGSKNKSQPEKIFTDGNLFFSISIGTYFLQN